MLFLFSCSFMSDSLWPHSCCNPMDCSTPGFPVLYHLPELAQTHVHWVGDAIWSSVTPFSSCLQSFPASGSFPMSLLFASGGQSIGASASVLPMNTQGWFPLGWTGLISLQSKRLSRVFSNTTVQKHQFFGTQICNPVLLAIVIMLYITSHDLLYDWKFVLFIPFTPLILFNHPSVLPPSNHQSVLCMYELAF